MVKLRKRLNAVLASRISVDREGSGRINGVSVITTGPALGHGFDVDAEMVQQTADALSGQPGRWTHGNLCDDGLGKHLGAWENARTETFQDEDGVDQTRALADFVFADSAHKIQPDGLSVSAPEYLMDRTEEDPSSLGVSIVADLSIQEAEEDELSEGGSARLARLEVPEDLKRADFVADPAANRHGLSALFLGTPSELAEAATDHLNKVVSKFGTAKVHEFLEKALSVKLVSATDYSALKLENVRLAKSIADARESEVDTYLESLADQSAKAQSPIAPADLDDVRGLFALGKDAVARKFGATLVRVALATAEGPLSVTTSEHFEAPKSDPRKASIAMEVKMLSQIGWTDIETNEDGTEITKATPPKARI